MSILDYFSTNPNKRAKFIFNFIAPIYKNLVKDIEKKYQESINIIEQNINIQSPEVIDIGTGTGVWGQMFYKYLNAKRVLGIDFAERMTQVAKENYPHIEFLYCDAEQMKKIPDKSFDVATASYVLHGVKKDRRRKILEQMKRVARRYVIIHDFAGRISTFVYLLELLEKSDAFYFRKHFREEMQSIFQDVELFITPSGAGIYISKVNDQLEQKKPSRKDEKI